MAFGPAKSDVGFFGGLGLMGRAFLLALLSVFIDIEFHILILLFN